MNILLIEDHPTDRKLLSAVLTTGGNHVVERSAAEDAIEVIKRDWPDVILLDLKLPGMDGLGLTRRLKEDEETRHIPIVAMTAAAEQFSREEALRAGCDAYIVKPVDTRRVAEQVSNAKDLLR